MARWIRAARRLNLSPGSRVLDLGCAFGFGTRFLTPRYQAFGHDLSHEYIERAQKSVPQAIFTRGPAERVPYPDHFFDAVLLLDVLEHVPNEGAVIEEVRRILRRGGKLIVSVPNKGMLANLDSLNLYVKLAGYESPPPTEDPSWSISPVHRHYSLVDLQQMLGRDFRMNSHAFSGFGVAEPLNLVFLLIFRRLLGLPKLYDRLQYLYFFVYLLEDLIQTNDRGYHLLIEAQRL